MDILKDIFNSATGGVGELAKDIVDTAKQYFPPSMSDKEKADMSLALQKVGYDHEAQINAAISDGEKAVNDRLAIYEGTASDLKALPIVGPLMLFLRGAQRPIIGYAMLWLDYKVFAGMWALDTPLKNSSFYIINLLVLGFLFGERAVRNVAPLITDMVKGKA